MVPYLYNEIHKWLFFKFIWKWEEKIRIWQPGIHQGKYLEKDSQVVHESFFDPSEKRKMKKKYRSAK